MKTNGQHSFGSAMGDIYLLRSFGFCPAAHEAVPIPKTPKNKVATGTAGTGPRAVTTGPDLHWSWMFFPKWAEQTKFASFQFTKCLKYFPGSC